MDSILGLIQIRCLCIFTMPFALEEEETENVEL